MPNTIYDFQWFANMDAYKAHVNFEDPEIKNAIMGYVGLQKPGFSGVVFGNWDDAMQKALSSMGAKFKYVKSKTGFIRAAEQGRKGPATILWTSRRIKMGKMPALK